MEKQKSTPQQTENQLASRSGQPVSPSASQTPTPPTPEVPVDLITPKKNSLFFLFLLVFVSLLIIASSAYFLINPALKIPKDLEVTPTTASTSPSSTPDPTADWETYTDTTKGFSVKYPSSLKMVERSDYFTDFTDMSLNEDGSTAEKDVLHFQEGGISGSGSELVEKGFRLTIYIEQKGISNATRDKFRNNALNATKISVNGQEAYKEIINEEVAGYNETSIDVTVLKDNNIYKITSNFFLAEKQEYIRFFDQILSTFKFTDQSEDITNWKTFTNSKIGYVIKYPEDKYLSCNIQGDTTNFNLNKKTGQNDTCFAGEGPPSLQLRVNPDDIKSRNTFGCYDLVKKPIKILGFEGTRYTNEILSSSGNCMQASAYAKHEVYDVFEKNGTRFMFFYYQDDEDLDVIKEIISTLQFSK